MRFHFGVSFRWHTIKKFLLPFLIGVLSFLGLSKFNILQVFASSNFDTTFTFDLPTSSNFSDDFSSDKNYKEFLDSLIPTDESDYYYYLVLSAPTLPSMDIYLIPKDDTIPKFNLYYYSGYMYLFGFKTTQYKMFSFGVNLTPFSERAGVDTFQNCFYNNVCPSSAIPEQNNNGFQLSFYSVNSGSSLAMFKCVGCSGISNDLSYNLNDYPLEYQNNGFKIVFKTSYPMLINPTLIRSGTTGTSYKYKTNIMNGITLSSDVVFPSYYDLYYSDEPIESLSLPYYLNNLGTFFIGSIPKENISSIISSFSYDYTDFDNIDLINYNLLFYGRVNHSDNYYSYERIICSPTQPVHSTITDNSVRTDIFSSGFSCTNSLTSYDNIYVFVQPYNYDTTDSSIYNLEMTSNYGNIYRMDNSVRNYYDVYIYEKFENLSSNFQLLLSTLENEQDYYFSSDNKFVDDVPISKTDSSILLGSNSSFNSYTKIGGSMLGKKYNANVLIKNLTTYYSGTTNLNLFIEPDTIVSNYVNSSFYYYDDEDNLVDNNVVINVSVNPNDSYNVDSYLDIVNNYINDLNDDLYNFADIVQQSYDAIPNNFQVIIFISFIISCIYLTFLFVRW